MYRWYGAKIHDEHVTASPELVREAWSHAGGEDYLTALDDSSLDTSVASARRDAAALAGDDVGSPILAFETADPGAGDGGGSGGSTVGFFGPVLAPTPTGEEADRLWEAVLMAVSVPQFFELKTRRTATP